MNSTGGTQIKSPRLKKRGIPLQKRAKRDDECCVLTQFLSEEQLQIPQTGWVNRRICAHTPKWFQALQNQVEWITKPKPMESENNMSIGNTCLSDIIEGMSLWWLGIKKVGWHWRKGRQSKGQFTPHRQTPTNSNKLVCWSLLDQCVTPVGVGWSWFSPDWTCL